MKALFFLPGLLLLGLFLPVAAVADDAERLAEREARFEALREEIGELSQQLNRDRERAGGVEAELARIEQRIGEEQSALRSLDARIVERAQVVTELELAVAEEAERSRQHREFLAASLRAAYRRGPEEPLRLLLAETDSAALQRLIEYQRRLGAARFERVREAEAAMERYRERQAELQEALQAQREAREAREAGLGRLQESLAERESLLADLRSRIQSGDSRLTSREEEAESLQTLIAELQRRVADSGPVERAVPELARGRLAWPVQGPILARYGSERAAGLDWTGLLIGGEEGDPVYPAAAGQVIFADWLRGLGLLLIIDHGEGYLSLYGRNQALYFAVGEWVDPDDVIATVGRSGGRADAALYFELRANGEPIDPLAWLQTDGNRG